MECPTCGATETAHGEDIDTVHSLKIHHAKKHDCPLNAEEMTECKRCGEWFDTRRGMEVHHSIVHGDSLTVREASCNECGDTFEYYPSRRRGAYCSDCSHIDVDEHGRQARNRRRVQQVKENVGCANCSEEHSQVLEFHHLDEEKVDDISNMLNRPWEEVKQEMKKCMLLCRNCHAKVHNDIISVNS